MTAALVAEAIADRVIAEDDAIDALAADIEALAKRRVAELHEAAAADGVTNEQADAWADDVIRDARLLMVRSAVETALRQRVARGISPATARQLERITSAHVATRRSTRDATRPSRPPGSA